VPQLTADQAWTVIWYLGNQYWQVPDFIERCDVCGDLFDSEQEGGYHEEGPPYHYCDTCWCRIAEEGAGDAPTPADAGKE